MVNYLWWDRCEHPSSSSFAPSRHPEPKSNKTSGSTSAVWGSLTPGFPSAAGKSTVKLANKNVWNRRLCAGEDMPREINISARTNQEKLVRGGGDKAEQESSAPPIPCRDSLISGAESRPWQTRRSKVVSPLCWAAKPSLRSSPVAARVKRTRASVRIHGPHVLEWFNFFCSSAAPNPSSLNAREHQASSRLLLGCEV